MRYDYCPEKFWDSWYLAQGGVVSDQTTIGELSDRAIRFHYNSLENLILESLKDAPVRIALDFGAGAGHWTRFAKDILGAKYACAMDCSSSAREEIAYQNQAYLSDLSLESGSEFDCIFAIGVMFHIVDDVEWKATFIRLQQELKPGGFLFISGRFIGAEPEDVQFHSQDEFKTWAECYYGGPDFKVHKRLRPKIWYTDELIDGCYLETLWYNRGPEGYVMPQNNLMVIRKKK